MKIAFHTPNLNFRGSCVALYDYAHYCERLFGYQSVIVTDIKQHSTSDPIAIEWIRRRFLILFYHSIEELETILLKEDCNVLYCIKYGTNDRIYLSSIKTVIHCVFDMSQPHGDVYAGVSKTLAHSFDLDVYVPHMVSLSFSHHSNLRQQLNIPSDVIVFGRHGGMDTFNLEFAKEVISNIVRTTSIHFVFLNAPQWDSHPHIHYLPPTTDRYTKEAFINTCDAMIVPETMGHTFGLSIAEFSIRNKPIVCYNGQVWNRTHLDILGDKGIYFSTPEDLTNIFLHFHPQTKDYNTYKEYTPCKIMEKFKYIFL